MQIVIFGHFNILLVQYDCMIGILRFYVSRLNVNSYNVGTISGEGVKQRKGAFSSALDNRGYGWLLEVEEDDEELKPLLLVWKLFSC